VCYDLFGKTSDKLIGTNMILGYKFDDGAHIFACFN
jgi:hypothetical protein